MHFRSITIAGMSWWSAHVNDFRLQTIRTDSERNSVEFPIDLSIDLRDHKAES